MSSQIIPVEPFDCVVFGGNGDIPNASCFQRFYHRQVEGQFTEPTRIIGASRRHSATRSFASFADTALKEHLKPGQYDDDAGENLPLNV